MRKPLATQSLAKTFFDNVQAGGSAFLQQLVVDSTPEGEWLDFKCGSHLDDAETKVTWSRALSGFANNEGGVLVWGIDARFDKIRKIDVACDLNLVTHPEALRDRLRQLHPTATDPPLVGVDSKAFFEGGASGPGFVVSYVPESDVKPHRAEFIDGKPYMLRIGDTFKNPSPALLRNLFFPRSSTQLRVSVTPDWQAIELRPGMNFSDDIEILYRFAIHNAGLVTAKDVFVIVQMEPLALELETPYGAAKVATDFGVGIDHSRPLHPSSTAPLCAVRHRVGVGTRTSTGEHLLVPRPTSFAASFQIFAADTPPQMVRATITEWDIDHKQQKWAMPILENV